MIRPNDGKTQRHTHPFNGPFSENTRVSQYQKGKTNLDFTEARDSEWHWHQLGHMQVCTSLKTDKNASTPPLKFFAGWMPFLPPNQQCQSTESLMMKNAMASHHPHLVVRCAGTEVVHDTSSFVSVSAVARVHGTQQCQMHAAFTAVLAPLHLTVDNAGVVAVAIDVMHLRYVATALQTHTHTDTCASYSCT